MTIFTIKKEEYFFCRERLDLTKCDFWIDKVYSDPTNKERIQEIQISRKEANILLSISISCQAGKLQEFKLFDKAMNEIYSSNRDGTHPINWLLGGNDYFYYSVDIKEYNKRSNLSCNLYVKTGKIKEKDLIEKPKKKNKWFFF